MNKKWISITLLIVTTIGIVGCSNTSKENLGAIQDPGVIQDSLNQILTPKDILQKSWEADKDPEKPMIIGGLSNDLAEDSAKEFSLKDPSLVSTTYNLPLEVVEQAKSGAGFMNAMMANYFTVSALEFESGSDMNKIAEAIYNNLRMTNWLCATPEQYQVAIYKNFVITIYGLTTTNEAFVKAMKDNYAGVEVVYTKSVQ